MPGDIKVRARQIKLIGLDVDGVLTDGHLIYGEDGERLKFFHAHDGYGIIMAGKAGIITAIITQRRSRMVKIRADELDIRECFQGVEDKFSVIKMLIKKYNITLEEVAYIGDDILDYPVLTQVGLAFAVADAVAEIREVAHYITTRRGGSGAVREVINFILKAKDIEIIEK